MFTLKTVNIRGTTGAVSYTHLMTDYTEQSEHTKKALKRLTVFPSTYLFSRILPAHVLEVKVKK